MHNEEKKMGLKEAFLNKRMLNCIFNGLSAGLPIYFLVSLIPAWLRSEGVDLKTIGFFGFVLLPYSFKFLWAPLLDRYTPPFLGRRRGWMLITQVVCMLGMLAFSVIDAKTQIDFVLYAGVVVCFFSASQDIVLDAYRRELLPDNELGLGNTFYANAYRLAQFVPGSLGLILSDMVSWGSVFIIISLFMIISFAYSFMISENETNIEPPKNLKEAVVEPFKEFFKRDGFSNGVMILLFILFYKFGDTVATSLITPFYIDVGFSNTIIGSVSKLVGFWSMVIGGFIGGAIMFKVGINKSLWIFGIVQMASILGFAVLNEVGPVVWLLGVVVAFEYLGVGLGSAALMGFIAKNTNKNFTGTQLALLTSLFAIPKSFSGTLSGIMIEGINKADGIFFNLFGATSGIGYTSYFFVCTVLAVPGMILLFWVAPWNGKEEVV